MKESKLIIKCLTSITYIRHRLCRYTPKGEKSISKGEGSIRKYVTFCSPFLLFN